MSHSDCTTVPQPYSQQYGDIRYIQTQTVQKICIRRLFILERKIDINCSSSESSDNPIQLDLSSKEYLHQAKPPRHTLFSEVMGNDIIHDDKRKMSTCPTPLQRLEHQQQWIVMDHPTHTHLPSPNNKLGITYNVHPRPSHITKLFADLMLDNCLWCPTDFWYCLGKGTRKINCLIS